MEWQGIHEDLPARDYVCGQCGRKEISSSAGYLESQNRAWIYICTRCKCPTFFLGSHQIPGGSPVGPIEHLPDDVQRLWCEARKCFTVGAWTAVVMCCRKMLMNVAVDQGAKEGIKYSAYVDWIAKNKLAPGNEDWVERIRDMGGDANHAIESKDEEDAQDLMNFLEHLLRTVYEFPEKMRKKVSGDSS